MSEREYNDDDPVGRNGDDNLAEDDETRTEKIVTAPIMLATALAGDPSIKEAHERVCHQLDGNKSKLKTGWSAVEHADLMVSRKFNSNPYDGRIVNAAALLVRARQLMNQAEAMQLQAQAATSSANEKTLPDLFSCQCVVTNAHTVALIPERLVVQAVSQAMEAAVIIKNVMLNRQTVQGAATQDAIDSAEGQRVYCLDGVDNDVGSG